MFLSSRGTGTRNGIAVMLTVKPNRSCFFAVIGPTPFASFSVYVFFRR